MATSHPLRTGLLILALLHTGTAAIAQDFSYGASLFTRNCAACHGAAAEGDGPVAFMFATPPKNLRTLRSEATGAFPFSEVYQAIDGRRNVASHGSRAMPVWGDLFEAEALPRTVHPGVDADEIVQARILALVYFLQSIQE